MYFLQNSALIALDTAESKLHKKEQKWIFADNKQRHVYGEPSLLECLSELPVLVHKVNPRRDPRSRKKKENIVLKIHYANLCY